MWVRVCIMLSEYNWEPPFVALIDEYYRTCLIIKQWGLMGISNVSLTLTLLEILDKKSGMDNGYFADSFL